MPLRCNLDARGKRLRMVYGMFFMIGGIVLLFLWRSTTGRIVEVLMILAGGFMIFESRAGWCVVRALGWKTPT